MEDLPEARRAIVDFFDSSRSAEWEAFDDFCGLTVRLALIESRYTDAARLLGYFDKAVHRLGRVTPFGAAVRARAFSILEAQMDRATLDRLIDEGDRLDEEGACALALRTGRPPGSGGAA